MLVPRPICSHVGGAAPRRIAPDALSLNLRAGMSQQQAMLDLQEAQSLFQNEELLGGIWLPDLATMKQDLLGTTAAEIGAFVGYVPDQSGRGCTAVQNTGGNKPILAITPKTRIQWLMADSTDVLPVSFPVAPGSNCTIARATPAGVEFENNQTIGTTWNNLIRPWQYNSAVVVMSRKPTPYETALLTRLLGRYVPVLGSELLTNGDFSSGNMWWSLGVAASIANGVASISPGSSALQLYKSNTTVIGKLYYTSYTMLNRVSGYPSLYSSFTVASSGENKRYTTTYIANQTTYALINTANSQFDLDDISLKEVL